MNQKQIDDIRVRGKSRARMLGKLPDPLIRRDVPDLLAVAEGGIEALKEINFAIDEVEYRYSAGEEWDGGDLILMMHLESAKRLLEQE